MLNKRGQLGPQGLEDLPMAVMAFIVAIMALIMLLNVSSGHLNFSQEDDMHNAGKRLVETVAGEIFKSEESRSYGENVLDWDIVKEAHARDPTLKNLIGYIEYDFSVVIDLSSRRLAFGASPPESALSYGGMVSALVDSKIYNGEVIVKIWKK